MDYDPAQHNRRSVRIPHFDYGSIGSYFVTICSYERACLFGDVVDGQMVLSPIGEVVHDEWERTLTMREELVPSARVTMPNHTHMIVRIQWRPGKGVALQMPVEGRFTDGTGRRTLASIVGGYKGAVTSRLKAAGLLPACGVWQRGYYEHVIRNEYELERTATYIGSNPMNWPRDRENPNRIVDPGER